MSLDQFEITARWPTSPLPDTRDVAELRLLAAGEVLSRVSDFARKEERDFVRGSAVSLALWLADNFWRLRYESLPNGYAPSPNWRLRHELTSATGGTLWPPIMMHSTGDRVFIGPVLARPIEIGAIRYVLSEVVTVPGSTFEIGIQTFFEQVIDHCAQAVDGSILKELVETIRNEASDPELLSWRRLEARLGYDPDTVPDELMRVLAELEHYVGHAALDEAAAATPGKNAGGFLAKAVEAVKTSEIIVDLSIAHESSFNNNLIIDAPPWQLGRDAAHQIRKIAGVENRPILMKNFSDLFHVRPDELKRPSTARGIPYSARLRQRGERHRIALQSVASRDRRFELSCALADEIWAHDDFGIISKAKTDRQKFQRSFAQNFLVPFDGLAKMIDLSNPTEIDIDRAAITYHVHQNVIKRMLVLEGIIPNETFGDRIESA